jgi:hypothetical protein
MNVCSAKASRNAIAAVDIRGDDDDDTAMLPASPPPPVVAVVVDVVRARLAPARVAGARVCLLLALLGAGAVAAHEGHGATPAHVHPADGVAVDVGAALAAVVAGTAALAAARRRRSR